MICSEDIPIVNFPCLIANCMSARYQQAGTWRYASKIGWFMSVQRRCNNYIFSGQSGLQHQPLCVEEKKRFNWPTRQQTVTTWIIIRYWLTLKGAVKRRFRRILNRPTSLIKEKKCPLLSRSWSEWREIRWTLQRMIHASDTTRKYYCIIIFFSLSAEVYTKHALFHNVDQ